MLFDMNLKIVSESRKPEDYHQRFPLKRRQKTVRTEKGTALRPNLSCWSSDSPSGAPPRSPVPTENSGKPLTPMVQNSSPHTKAGISKSLSGKSSSFLQKSVASKPTCARKGRWPLCSTMQKRYQPLSEARSGIHQTGDPDRGQGRRSREESAGRGREEQAK